MIQQHREMDNVTLDLSAALFSQGVSYRLLPGYLHQATSFLEEIHLFLLQ